MIIPFGVEEINGHFMNSIALFPLTNIINK
jgi:hypothetical protein